VQKYIFEKTKKYNKFALHSRMTQTCGFVLVRSCLPLSVPSHVGQEAGGTPAQPKRMAQHASLPFYSVFCPAFTLVSPFFASDVFIYALAFASTTSFLSGNLVVCLQATIHGWKLGTCNTVTCETYHAIHY